MRCSSVFCSTSSCVNQSSGRECTQCCSSFMSPSSSYLYQKLHRTEPLGNNSIDLLQRKRKRSDERIGRLSVYRRIRLRNKRHSPVRLISCCHFFTVSNQSVRRRVLLPTDKRTIWVRSAVHHTNNHGWYIHFGFNNFFPETSIRSFNSFPQPRINSDLRILDRRRRPNHDRDD